MYDPLSNMSPGPACSILTPSQCPGEHSVCVSEIYLEDNSFKGISIQLHMTWVGQSPETKDIII